MQGTSQWLHLNKSSDGIYIYFNSEVGFSFIQDQQYLQVFFYISVFNFFWVALENSKNLKQSTTLLNPAAIEQFCKKVFVKTMKQFNQK